MRKWSLSCPHCGATLMEGTGDGGTIPPIFVPYFRCPICGRLSSTDANEFICMDNEQRSYIRASLKNCEYIAQSLDRTNNEEYRKFLSKCGFEFFPITDDDKLKFKNADTAALAGRRIKMKFMLDDARLYSVTVDGRPFLHDSPQKSVNLPYKYQEK